MGHSALVTGASGFIGRYLVAHLIQQGHDVVGLDIVPPAQSLAGARHHVCDILDQDKLRSIIEREQPSHLFHLAAKPRMDAASWQDFPEIVQGTRNVASAFTLSRAAKRLVNVSTQLVIAPKSGAFGLRDYDPYTHYGSAKAKAEQELDAASWPFEILHLRPTNIWGPHHPTYGTTILKYIRKRVYLQPSRADNVRRTYGYVRNSALQIAELGFMPLEDRAILYIGDDAMKTGAYLDALSRALTRKPIRRVPDTPLWLLAQVGALLNAAGIKFPYDKGRYFRMTTDYVVPIDLAREVALGKSVDFDLGIAETAAQYFADHDKN